MKIKRFIQVLALWMTLLGFSALAFSGQALGQIRPDPFNLKGPGALRPVKLPQKPIMENVFYNVLWGSLFGAIVATGVSAAETKGVLPSDFSEKLYTGATYGGLLGLIAGVWLSSEGIYYKEKDVLFYENWDRYFNPRKWQREQLQKQKLNPRASLPSPPLAPPIVLETTTSGPFRITGISARVLHFKF